MKLVMVNSSATASLDVSLIAVPMYGTRPYYIDTFGRFLSWAEEKGGE